MSDELVKAFNVMARDSFRLAYREKRLQPALDLISAFLDLDVGEKLRGRALHHRSIVLEMFDRYDEAYADLLEAYRLATDGNLFHRHALELGLNMNANRRGDRESELHWLRQSVQTVSNDPTTFGGTVALELIAHYRGQEHVPADERSACERILTNAWQLLKLPGEPDLSDLVSGLRRSKEEYIAWNERLLTESRKPPG